MVTSEKQKIYNVTVPKGGYGYYTLYRGIYDPSNNIDERPAYAETGDLFEPYNSSVVYRATRSGGKTTWAIDESAKRQSETGSGSGGGAEKYIVTLTEDDDVYTADKTIANIVAAANANKVVVAKIDYGNDMFAELPLSYCTGSFILFAGSSDDKMKSLTFVTGEAKDNLPDAWAVEEQEIGGSGGGGAEKFIVTITDNAGVTSNKTVAEILAAKAAGKEVVAHATSSTYSGQVIELPLMWSLASEQGSAVFFSGSAPRLGQHLTEAVYSVYCIAPTGQEEEWSSDSVELGEGVPSYSSSNNDQVLGVSSGDLTWVDNYAPLIVTLTEDQQNPGTYVGDKTFGEVYTAVSAGKIVYFHIPGGYSILNSCSLESGTYTIVAAVEEMTFTGTENDYPTVAIN